MANEVTKGKLFLTEVLARLAGDGKEALAAKLTRKAISAVEGNVAQLQSKKVDLEDSLEEAQESLATATYPTEMFTNNGNYIQNILNAQNQVDNAQEQLDANATALKYFNALLAKF